MVYFMSKLNWLFLKKPQISLRGKGENLAGLSPLRGGKGQNAGKPSANGGGQTGVQGGEAPVAGDCGECAPTKPKEGRVAHISNPATGGAQNAGKPSANGGGQRGVQGGEAPLTSTLPQYERFALGGRGGPPPPWRGAVGGVPRSRRLKSASLKKVGLRQVRA
jgi:hypothetical protein